MEALFPIALLAAILVAGMLRPELRPVALRVRTEDKNNGPRSRVDIANER